MYACISFLKHVNLSLCTILFQTNVSYIYIYIYYIDIYIYIVYIYIYILYRHYIDMY